MNFQTCSLESMMNAAQAVLLQSPGIDSRRGVGEHENVFKIIKIR